MDELHVEGEKFEEAREQLQREVLEAIQRFEGSTGMEVSGIAPRRLQIFGQRDSPVATVDIAVDLPTWWRTGHP
jgi:hypothetical protein